MPLKAYPEHPPWHDTMRCPRRHHHLEKPLVGLSQCGGPLLPSPPLSLFIIILDEQKVFHFLITALWHLVHPSAIRKYMRQCFVPLTTANYMDVRCRLTRAIPIVLTRPNYLETQ